MSSSASATADPGWGVPVPPREEIAAAVGRVRGLAGRSFWSLPTSEVRGCLEQVAVLKAVTAELELRLVAEADRRRDGARPGSDSEPLGGQPRLEPGQIKRQVRLARVFDRGHCTATRDALAAGEITIEHAWEVVHAVTDLPDDADQDVRDRVEHKLLETARLRHPGIVRRHAKVVLEEVDQDVADRELEARLAEEERRAHRTRELNLHQGRDGRWRLKGTLDDETGRRLQTALDPLSTPRPTAADGPDTRSAGQRRHDALNELLRRYLNAPARPTHGGNPVDVVISVTDVNLWDQAGHGIYLRDGTPVAHPRLEEILCDTRIAWLRHGTPDATGPPDPAGGCGTCTDYAITDPVRLFKDKVRRVLEARDRGCAFPGCDRPVEWCHAHHIKAWTHGGPTSIDNGVLLCGKHHRLIHQGEWVVRMAEDGFPEFVPPRWVDPDQSPLRNTIHRRC